MTRRPPTTEIRIVLRTIFSAGVLAVLLVLAGAGTAAGATGVVDDDGAGVMQNEVSGNTFDYTVPYLRQTDYPDCGESACGPTSIAMIIRYYYPNSKVSGYDIYRMGTQGYKYYVNTITGAPAKGYRNVGFAEDANGNLIDTGLNNVPDEFKKYYHGTYSGMTRSAGVRALGYWGGDVSDEGGCDMSRVIEEIRIRPLLLNVNKAAGIDVLGHWIVLRGYDDNGTKDVKGDDKFYINDPYTSKTYPNGEKREIAYNYLQSMFKGTIITYIPDKDLTEEQRLYTVLVDNGFNQNIHPSAAGKFEVSNIDALDVNGKYIWLEYYNPACGDWMYPNASGQSAVWTPVLAISGHYAIYVNYYADPTQNIVRYGIYDSNNNLLGSKEVNQSISPFNQNNGFIGEFNLENGCYVKVEDMPANCNADIVKFEYIDPISRGLQHLRTTHNPDGSWSSDVGVTSLAALCFMNAGYDETDSDVRDAIGYIRSKVQGDGSIWSSSYSKTYHTSLATLALVATHNDSYDATIDNATQWLNDSQWDENCLWGSVNTDSWYYGGFGYGYHVRPDNSNTQFALMALDAVQGISKDDPLWDKAQVFLNRVQARDESNDQPWANGRNSGGFIYRGDGGTAGGGSINGYGSMTGAGIWGMRLSNVKKDDPRVEAAVGWVTNNYMWDGNPGMGNIGAGQYYYYLSMSKALTMTGTDFIGKHNWYQDLSNNLTALQKPEGYWVNDRSSWAGEDNKDLVTSYAILSLQTRGDIPPDIQRLSWLTFILHSNADLHVYDPLGRHVGINYDTGEVEIQIPNATYTSNGEQNITVPHLEAGNYRIVLVGTGTGEYTLDVTGGVGDYVVSEDSFTSAISEGEVHDADVNVAMITWLTIHIEEPDPVNAMVESATGTGNVSFVSDAGTIEDLTALNESDLPEENPGADFPHGLFSFNITGLSNGETVNVTIAFPEDIPTTAEYWKYNTLSGEWYQIPIGSNDGDNIITITLQDGGIGDNDGATNGIISDPGGPGVNIYNITFLPPITTMDHFNLTNGRTLPIKFTARDNDTGEFIYDDTVNVTITNSTGPLIAFFTNGTGTDSVRINSTKEQYIVNFHTKNYDLNVGETYTIHVTFGEADALRGHAMTNFTLVDRKH